MRYASVSCYLDKEDQDSKQWVRAIEATSKLKKLLPIGVHGDLVMEAPLLGCIRDTKAVIAKIREMQAHAEWWGKTVLLVTRYGHFGDSHTQGLGEPAMSGAWQQIMDAVGP